MPPSSAVVVLVVAAGAAWESAALTALNGTAGVVVLKRCVDVDDLLAAAALGQSEVAVVALDSPGLDRSAVDHLHRHGVRPVAVAPAALPAEASRLRAGRVGIGAVVGADRLEELPAAVLRAAADEPDAAAAYDEEVAGPLGPRPSAPPGRAGRVLAVWGPPGAPGRTTVAAGLAAELARRGLRTTLVDADPQAASVAQQLGVLDEVSGLLAASRLAGGPALGESFAGVQRSLGPGLTVVTGLPRPDRWLEVRPGTVEHLLRVAREHGQVVVDTGPSLEEDPGGDFGSRPGRHQQTLEALDAADEVLVVGAADPVGLSRLARGLVELRDRLPATPVHVVVNRMRSSLGWSEKDVEGMVAGFARTSGLHFLPDDPGTVDRALVTGSTLVEQGDGPVVRAVATLADSLLGAGGAGRPGQRRQVGRLRRRRAGRARPR